MESARKEKAQLPRDTYQVEVSEGKTCHEGMQKEVAENSFEAWIARLVEKRAKRTPSKRG